MDVSVIIVNWNSVRFLPACLNSILAHAADMDMEVIVIDGASHDGSEELLRRDFPWVRFIQAGANLGFAKCNNLAAHTATGEYLLFLNPDTELRGPAMHRLLTAARSLPHSGALGAKLYNADGSVQTSCIQAFPTLLNQFLDAEALRTKTPSSSLWGMAPLFSGGVQPTRVQVISGACLFLNRKLFNEIGGFNESFFMYFEDTELCWRLDRLGRFNYFVPTAEVMHVGGGATAEANVKEGAIVRMADAAAHYFTITSSRSRARLYRYGMGLISILRLGILGMLRCMLAKAAHTPSHVKWLTLLKWAFSSGSPRTS